MDARDLGRALARWRDHDLISADQAEAIAAFEAEGDALAPEDAAPVDGGGFEAGSVLAYAGVLVALGAVGGLYITVFSDMDNTARLVLSWLIVAAAVGMALGSARVHAGEAMADALGFAATLLLIWSTMQTFDTIGWLDDVGDTDRRMRIAWLVTGIVVVAAGWLLARRSSPMAALSAAAALAWTGTAIVWLFSTSEFDGPGTLGGQVAVIVGFAVVGVAAVLPEYTGLGDRARTWAIIGGLGAANLAGFVIAADDGGVYEGLLLFYAVGLGIAAVLLRRRSILVFAAITLYEYVGLVVFRTFDGAVAAIIILALIGLGTAIGGTMVQRGLGGRILAGLR